MRLESPRLLKTSCLRTSNPWVSEPISLGPSPISLFKKLNIYKSWDSTLRQKNHSRTYNTSLALFVFHRSPTHLPHKFIKLKIKNYIYIYIYIFNLKTLLCSLYTNYISFQKYWDSNQKQFQHTIILWRKGLNIQEYSICSNENFKMN